MGKLSFNGRMISDPAGLLRFDTLLLSGGEEFFKKELIKVLTSAVIEFPSLDDQRFQASETPVSEVLDACNTFPMLNKRKLTVLNGLGGYDEESLKKLASYVLAPSSSCLLIMTASGFPPAALSKASQEKGCEIVFYPPKDDALAISWITGMFRKEGLSLPSAAASAIIDAVGEDMHALSSEAEKLMPLFRAKGSISFEELKNYFSSIRTGSIEDLTDRICGKDPRGALRALDTLLDSGEEPVKLLYIIKNTYNQLLFLKESQEENGEELFLEFKKLFLGRLPDKKARQKFSMMRESVNNYGKTDLLSALLSVLSANTDLRLKGAENTRLVMEKIFFKNLKGMLAHA